MNDKSVAVLGGGACGHSISAYLAGKDYDVRLCELPEFVDSIEPLIGDSTIHMEGAAGEGDFQLSLATIDFAKAVSGCKWILLVVPAYGHEAFATALAPHLMDGQIVVVNPGPSLGSLAFRHHLDQLGSKADITLAETHWVTLNGKLIAPDKVAVGMWVPVSWFAALPASDTPKISDQFTEMFPNAKPTPTVLHASLESFNIMAHSAPMVLNAGRVEYAQGEYRHYAEGISPSVARVIDEHDRERRNLCQALRIDTMPHHQVVADIWPIPDAPDPKSSYAAYQTPGLEKSYGPATLESRYLTEDIPYGLVSWVSMGDAIGVEMPVCKALITLASSLMGKDYMKEGRTLSNIGVSGVDSAEALLELVK